MQGGAQRGGDADDPFGLDPRRLHAQAIARVRRQLPALAQHPHAAAGMFVCRCDGARGLTFGCVSRATVRLQRVYRCAAVLVAACREGSLPSRAVGLPAAFWPQTIVRCVLFVFLSKTVCKAVVNVSRRLPMPDCACLVLIRRRTVLGAVRLREAPDLGGSDSRTKCEKAHNSIHMFGCSVVACAAIAKRWARFIATGK